VLNPFLLCAAALWLKDPARRSHATEPMPRRVRIPPMYRRAPSSSGLMRVDPVICCRSAMDQALFPSYLGTPLDQSRDQLSLLRSIHATNASSPSGAEIALSPLHRNRRGGSGGHSHHGGYNRSSRHGRHDDCNRHRRNHSVALATAAKPTPCIDTAHTDGEPYVTTCARPPLSARSP
jgi:hypothetical protein